MDNKPQKCPNNASKHNFFGPKVCFFIIILFYHIFILTCYHHHVAALPDNSHHPSTFTTGSKISHHNSHVTGQQKHQKVVSLPFFVWVCFSPPLNLFHPTNHTYGCSCVCSTDCFLVFILFSRFTDCLYEQIVQAFTFLTHTRRPTPRNGSLTLSQPPQKTPKWGVLDMLFLVSGMFFI